MGAEPVWIDEAMRPLYHVGLAFGSNNLVTLVAQAADLLAQAGVEAPQQMLGPLLGAAVFVVLQDYLSSVTVNWMSFVGMLFVAVVLFFPRGLLGFIGRKSET